MKKIISLLLVAVIMLSVSGVCTFAYSPVENYHYLDRFVEEYGQPQFYEELYWHYTDEGNTVVDWALINVATEIMVEPIENPTPNVYIVGDIVYSTIYHLYPFQIPYCVYDVEKDKFIEISMVDFDEYEGLKEVFCTPEYGKLIGDADDDDEISILDATQIQLVLAELSEFKSFHVADYNRDRSVDITDATAIQLMLAGF